MNPEHQSTTCQLCLITRYWVTSGPWHVTFNTHIYICIDIYIYMCNIALIYMSHNVDTHRHGPKSNPAEALRQFARHMRPGSQGRLLGLRILQWRPALHPACFVSFLQVRRIKMRLNTVSTIVMKISTFCL